MINIKFACDAMYYYIIVTVTAMRYNSIANALELDIICTNSFMFAYSVALIFRPYSKDYFMM